MKKRLLILLSILWLCTVEVADVMAFENEYTHPAMTKMAVGGSVLDDYLRNQLGLSAGANTELELTEAFKNRIDMRVAQSENPSWDETTLSIENWLVDGSKLEDVPMPRGRHHFHDPISNRGLRNSKGRWWAVWLLKRESKKMYPDYHAYDASGESNLDTALGTHAWMEPPPVNYNQCDWIEARLFFYDAVTEPFESDREKYLANMFLILGHVCHFLQDVGVPAHARNDWLMGHTLSGWPKYERITGVKRSISSGGNPFETWLESQIQGDEIPNRFLHRLMASPPAFAKVAHYWDTDTCVESGIPQWQGQNLNWPTHGFGNPPPEKDWGLAECSNYQFLSHSTVFKKNDTRTYQSFPHPAKGNLKGHSHTKVGNSIGYYYGGYDVVFLARVTYTEHTRIVHHEPMTFALETTTPEDTLIFEDYARRTVPRTIDYTSGLINYFFRGRLSVEPVADAGGQVTIDITNISKNSGVPQALRGGTFELYADDNSGNRTKVTSLAVAGWGGSSILGYEGTVTATFIPAAAKTKYTLIYSGQINPVSDPTFTDVDDPWAIAVGTFGWPGVVGMCWTDEACYDRCICGSYSDYYCNAALYDEDLGEYGDMLEANQDSTIRSGCMVPPLPGLPPGIEPVLPKGYSPPTDPYISVEICGRPPSKNEIIDDFDRIRGNLRPSHLVLCVDNSSSMDTSTIQPGYGEFKTWVRENYPDTVILERPFYDKRERWVRFLRLGIEDAIDAMSD